MDVMFTAHPVLTMHIAMRDGVPYMEKGDKPAVMKGALNPLKTIKLLTTGFDLYSSLSRHVIIRIPGRCYLLSVFHHLIFDLISSNVFTRHFLRALEGNAPLVEATSSDSRGPFRVDDHFLKIAAFHQEVRSTERYAEMDKYIRSMLGNLTEAHFYRNPGKKGKPGYHKRELDVDREQVNRFTNRFGITKNILFTAAMAMALSKLAGNDEVAFGFLFQFFPDWIVEDEKYDHLPRNEMLVNKIISMQKDFMVEALVNVTEMKDNYSIRILYSGYYSRKMMKALAKTYKDTLTEMLLRFPS